MIDLNKEQELAVLESGNVLVTACPGSGKTRVLTYRVIRGLEELESEKHRVVALTFTNRATDEIQSRLDRLFISRERLWTGTIHAFALDWILRPYLPYLPRIQRGFSIADEFLSQRILNELKVEFDKPRFLEVNTVRDRHGNAHNTEVGEAIFQAYQERLEAQKMLDYDDLLYYAYKLLVDIPEIALTLAAIIRLVCMDEVQDTQDLQYGILSTIFKASSDPPTIFFVGDSDQCIYESLGAVTKTSDEIAIEFGLDSIKHLGLTGNYRSTQRIIDLYQCFRPEKPHIKSLTSYADRHGMITLSDGTVNKDDLPHLIVDLIRDSLRTGIAPSQICVLAPQWWHIRSLGRHLAQLLPEVGFDAPGLSPLHAQRDNFWFKLARLILTMPSPSLYQTRFRWARELIRELQEVYGAALQETFEKPRALLRLVNSLDSPSEDGLLYLDDIFSKVTAKIEGDENLPASLSESRELFFDKARNRIEDIGGGSPTVNSLRNLFRHPFGVVVSTCHGIKGEEYETVIAFGLLEGYVPNWRVIFDNDSEMAHEQASKLLYVICSRAKRRLHLVAESGRLTRSNHAYRTTPLLKAVQFAYDPTPHGS